MLIRKIHIRGKVCSKKADLDKIATLAEFEGFKQTLFEKRKSYRETVDVKIIKSTDQEEIKQLRKQR